MNVFAKFDKIPSMILEVIKETKRYGHTFGRTVVRSDNVKTVYPPTNTVCGGYNNCVQVKSIHGRLSPSAQHRVVYRKMCRRFPVVLHEIRK